MWPSFVTLLVLAVIGPVLAQDSPGVMMPGISSRTASMVGPHRRPRPIRMRPTSEPLGMAPHIHFPDIVGMFNSPRVVPIPVNDKSVGKDDGRETPMIEMMDDMNFDTLGMSELGMLNSISTIEDFAAMMGIDVPVDNTSASAGISARFGPSEGIDMDLPQATCAPGEETVRLALPREANVVYMPYCVRLQRCGGCCHGNMLQCRPTSTQAVNIRVLRVTSSARSTGPTLGRERPSSVGRVGYRGRRNTVAEMITVPEEQHTACKCLCRVQPEDCSPDVQEYLPDDCKCQCKNRDEKSKCDAMKMTHYWDEQRCGCYCLTIRNCTVTLKFDHASCSCVPANSLDLNPRTDFSGSNGVDFDDGERSRRDHVPVVFDRRDIRRRQERDTEDAEDVNSL